MRISLYVSAQILFFGQSQASRKVARMLQRTLLFFLNHLRVSCWLDDLSLLKIFEYFPPKQEVLHKQNTHINRVKNALLCLPLQTTLTFANCPKDVLYNKKMYNNSSGSVVRFLWSPLIWKHSLAS